ncbi:DUF222 domain-containing protein [Actinoplanes sp. NPDC051513]|uniref:HNH endonuclease signature motif containing protein n=1 Tax=Actinoplanes sp. NPDC051513 TaxID=3363908 RepID=UPI00379210F7
MLDTVHRWEEEATKAADSSLWPLPDAELLDLLRATHRLQQTVAALQIRVVREATLRELPTKHGHRTPAAWLRDQLRLDHRPARDLAEAAAILQTRPAVERALIDGLLDIRQATTIAAAVNAVPYALSDALAATEPDATAARVPATDSDDPSHLDPDRVANHAESTLIEMAAQFPAYQLRKLGDRILAHVAPEIAELADEAALRRAEARAHPRRSLTLSLPVEGLVRLSGALGVEDAAIVSAALQPLCGPMPDDDRSFPQRRADALIDVCRLALRTGELPHDGGEPPQLALTIPFAPLASQLSIPAQPGRLAAHGRPGQPSAHAQPGQLGVGVLPDDERISAATTRRLACDARILPLILGSASQVLDAGRSRRLAHGALRRALTVRDGGCAFPGCDRPSRWCDAHHLRPWSDGGRTDLDNLVLLCRHHHRLLHAPAGGWQAHLGKDRLPVFVPPPWIDPQQRPRRNLFHPRT